MTQRLFRRGLSKLALVLLAGLALSGSMGVARAADAPAACDATILSGPYALNLTGAYYDSQGYSYYFAMVGLVTFDGAGNVSGTSTLSLDGTVSKRKLSGTYTINSDCTGTLTWTGAVDGSTALTLNADLVLTSAGKEINYMDSDADVIVTGLIKKQTP